MHVPRLFGELFGQYHFSCSTVSQVGHYLHPIKPSIEQGMDHNPSAADCEGGINCYFGVRAYQFIWHTCAPCHISGIPRWALKTEQKNPKDLVWQWEL